MTAQNLVVRRADNSIPNDPYVREKQTFPKLSQEQIDRLIPHGYVQRLKKGHGPL
jgi:hypothetical protein